MTILIISTVADVATDAVVQRLINRGVSHQRINTEDFPFEQSVTIDYQAQGRALMSFSQSAAAPTAIWYRRVRSPARPASMDPGIYDFCLRESRTAMLGGVLTQAVSWMSHPGHVWIAEFKPYQLQIAKQVGLRIPKTIVSNDPVAIRAAYHEIGPLIVKPTRSGYFRQGDDEYSIFTSRLTEEHLDRLDDAKWSPSIYQEWVRKRYDIRVTCVGSRIFAAAIHSQTDPATTVDWRKTCNPDLPHSMLELPAQIIEKILNLMSRLGLEFGCVDLVLTPDGDYVFLEVNPSGQWLWLDDRLSMGISDAVADWLAVEACRVGDA